MFYCCVVVQQRSIIDGMQDKELLAKAKIMKALSSPVRLKIIEELSHGERCICELQPLFPKDKSTLSRHIAELRNVGIISERREVVRSYLKLQTPCILKIFDCALSVIHSEAQRHADLIEASELKVAQKGKA